MKVYPDRTGARDFPVNLVKEARRDHVAHVGISEIRAIQDGVIIQDDFCLLVKSGTVEAT